MPVTLFAVWAGIAAALILVGKKTIRRNCGGIPCPPQPCPFS